jgi:hypothetical protein
MQFAVEIRRLRAVGLGECDLRWMICRQLIEHADEITRIGENRRHFQPLGELNLTERTCFVVTSLGVDVFDSGDPRGTTQHVLPDGTPSGNVDRECHTARKLQPPNSQKPQWDPIRHELRLGERLIKRFRHRSPNQEAILAAFEEEGWPRQVDDPLTPVEDGDPKRRLNDTIKGLNHHQENPLMRFHGDGTGEAIFWETVKLE